MSDESSRELVAIAVLRGIELITQEQLIELARRREALAMRQSGEARCGTCVYWTAATLDWMQRHGRTRPRVNDWTGWCTSQNRPPRQVRGDTTERQESALPCGRFLPRVEDYSFTPSAAERRHPRRKP
jgi:hypothetical protein